MLLKYLNNEMDLLRTKGIFQTYSFKKLQHEMQQFSFKL